MPPHRFGLGEASRPSRLLAGKPKLLKAPVHSLAFAVRVVWEHCWGGGSGGPKYNVSGEFGWLASCYWIFSFHTVCGRRAFSCWLPQQTGVKIVIVIFQFACLYLCQTENFFFCLLKKSVLLTFRNFRSKVKLCLWSEQPLSCSCKHLLCDARWFLKFFFFPVAGPPFADWPSSGQSQKNVWQNVKWGNGGHAGDI